MAFGDLFCFATISRSITVTLHINHLKPYLRKDRRAAKKCHLLRNFEPAASDAAEMINESSTGINPGEVVDESFSSDRFGLWLGFHNCDQDTFFEILDNYVAYYNLEIERKLHAEAIEWSITRGARSGRVRGSTSRSRWATKKDLRLIDEEGSPATKKTFRINRTFPRRNSKCSCALSTLPVRPTLDTICPRSTLSPVSTSNSELWA